MLWSILDCFHQPARLSHLGIAHVDRVEFDGLQGCQDFQLVRDWHLGEVDVGAAVEFAFARTTRTTLTSTSCGPPPLGTTSIATSMATTSATIGTAPAPHHT